MKPIQLRHLKLSTILLPFACFIMACGSAVESRDLTGKPLSSSTDSVADSPTIQPAPSHNFTSEVAYLEDEPAFFAARMQMLDKATKSVRIQSLIFYSDESSKLISNKLLALVERGVEVDIIIDPVFNRNVKEHKLFLELVSKGVRLWGYEKLYSAWIHQALQIRTLQDMFMTLNMRYHEKLFIIDGELPQKAQAIIGGANMANDYFAVVEGDPMNRFVDRDVAVRGSVVADLTKAFDATKDEFAQRRLTDPNGAQPLLDLILDIQDGPIPLSDMNQSYLNTLAGYAAKPLNLNWQPVNVQFIQSRPRFKEDKIFPEVVKLINSAKAEILIANAYFVPEKALVDALANAVKRGVKVKILTNTRDIIEIPILVDLGRSKFKAILDANSAGSAGNVEIYEWGGFVVFSNEFGQNHSKYMVVDRQTVMIGSYNFDLRSRLLNSESVVVFSDVMSANQYAAEFYGHIVPSLSTLLTYEEAEAYNNPDSVFERFKLRLLNRFAIIF